MCFFVEFVAVFFGHEFHELTRIQLESMMESGALAVGAPPLDR